MIVSVGLGISELQAQYHEVKLDAGGLIMTNFGLGYEYCINDDMGINLRLGYFTSGTLIESDDDYNTFTITADYRYYLDYNEGADGSFVSGYLKYRNLVAENYFTDFDPNTGEFLDAADFKSNGVAFGLTYGRKWVTNSGFLFESYGGVGRYIIENESVPEGYEDLEYLSFPWDFRIGLIVGWRFE